MYYVSFIRHPVTVENLAGEKEHVAAHPKMALVAALRNLKNNEW
jgi:hypothetical protein